MGLAERRVTKEFQENVLPGLVTKINEAAKCTPEVNVNWEKLAEDDYSHLYLECWEKVYFTPLIDALTDITKDDMGAEALAESLKTIEITNDSDCSNAGRWASFEGGVLKLDHKPHTNVDYIKDRKENLIKLLESSL